MGVIIEFNTFYAVVIDICKSENLSGEHFVWIETVVLRNEIDTGNFKIPDCFGFLGSDSTFDPYKLFVR